MTKSADLKFDLTTKMGLSKKETLVRFFEDKLEFNNVTIAFSEIESVSFHITNKYVNGVYENTEYFYEIESNSERYKLKFNSKHGREYGEHKSFRVTKEKHVVNDPNAHHLLVLIQLTEEILVPYLVDKFVKKILTAGETVRIGILEFTAQSFAIVHLNGLMKKKLDYRQFLSVDRERGSYVVNYARPNKKPKRYYVSSYSQNAPLLQGVLTNMQANSH